jgi:predicted Na+-dependent transporter
VIGLNRDLLLSQPQVVLFTAVIGAAGSFGLAFVLERALARLGMERALRVTCILMGTIKNTSLAAATALALFGQRAAVPAAVISALNVAYLVWLGVKHR